MDKNYFSENVLTLLVGIVTSSHHKKTSMVQQLTRKLSGTDFTLTDDSNEEGAILVTQSTLNKRNRSST